MFSRGRGGQLGSQTQILAVALTAIHPLLESLRRLDHEFPLASGLDASRASAQARSYNTVRFNLVSELRGVTVTN
jgi:hypothetical protein